LTLALKKLCVSRLKKYRDRIINGKGELKFIVAEAAGEKEARVQIPEFWRDPQNES
jgi:hypothetical protein